MRIQRTLTQLHDAPVMPASMYSPADEMREAVHEDELFFKAARLVIICQQASNHFLQHRLHIRSARAESLLDLLEAAGIIGESMGGHAREVRVDTLGYLQRFK